MDIGEDIWLNIALQVEIKDIFDLNCLCNLYCVNKSANSVLSSAYFWKLKYAKDGLEAPRDEDLSLREYYVHYKASYYIREFNSILNSSSHVRHYMLINTSEILCDGVYSLEDVRLTNIIWKIRYNPGCMKLYIGELNNDDGEQMYAMYINNRVCSKLLAKSKLFLLLQYFIMFGHQINIIKDRAVRSGNDPLIKGEADREVQIIKFVN